MINETKVVNTLSMIQDTCLADLNSLEKLIVISNLLLIEAEQYLPDEIKNNAKQILLSGKRINYEQLQYDDNLGLSLASKAHYIISEVDKHFGDSLD